MINEKMFRLKKNGNPYKGCYCRHPEKIENYGKAMADTTQVWEVHHRLESCFTQKFLKEMNLYYDVEPEALIFLTKSEHSKVDSMHKRNVEALRGKKKSEETKRKMSKAKKGRPSNNRRKILCVETNETFDSAYDAERKTGIFQSGISKACRGKYKTAGGLHWKFYN